MNTGHVLIPGQQFLRDCHDAVRLDAELFLEFLERRRSDEGVHTDDAALPADVALPSQGGSLLHGDAGFTCGGSTLS
jgi:hypothetical protein